MFFLHKIKLCVIIIVQGDVIMTFGETLKRLRQRKNISQDELARKLNIKQYVISSWEIGRSEPNIEQIKFLSTYFNVPTDYLLGKDVIMVNDEKEFEIVTNHFKQDINDDVINEVIKLLEELSEKDKNKIIVIGDSLSSDILGAANADLDCIWLNAENTALPEDYRVDYTVNSLKELENIFL